MAVLIDDFEIVFVEVCKGSFQTIPIKGNCKVNYIDDLKDFSIDKLKVFFIENWKFDFLRRLYRTMQSCPYSTSIEDCRYFFMDDFSF